MITDMGMGIPSAIIKSIDRKIMIACVTSGKSSKKSENVPQNSNMGHFPFSLIAVVPGLKNGLIKLPPPVIDLEETERH